MLHGPQRGCCDLEFAIPSVCADHLRDGLADIGIVPSFELERQDLDILPGLGIATRGPVRSILMISRVPARQIRTLAVDNSSRTSVQLSRVILRDGFGAEPELVMAEPDLNAMLRIANAALIIGDPALQLDPATLPYYVYDLGEEWVRLTGLPMVFAVWAGRAGSITPERIGQFHASYQYGRTHIEDILRQEALPRGFPMELAKQYLTQHIVYELGDLEYQGLDLFRSLTRQTAMSS